MKQIILILSLIFITACSDDIKSSEEKEIGYIADITMIEQVDTTKTFDDIKTILGEPNSKEFQTNAIVVTYLYHASKEDVFAKKLIITIDKFTGQIKKVESKSQF